MSFLAKYRDEGLISAETLQKLNSFTDLILQWNPRIDLTAMSSKEGIEEILIGECILAMQSLHLRNKHVLDFGSGAGIPGLVWVMADPTIRLTSLEIRAKKVAFQKEVARKLDLKAEILCGRFPDAVKGREFDVIATRAIRFDPKLWEESLRLGGELVRFGTATETQKGWTSTRISERSSILTRQRST